MANSERRLIDHRDVKTSTVWRWLLCALCLGLSLGLLQISSFGESLDQKLVQPLEFRLRTLWKKSPALDPKLKIYFMDDRSVGSLGRDDLDLHDWSHFFQSVAKAKPRLIMIDKLFGSPRGSYNAEQFRSELASAGVPIASIVYLTDQVIQFVPPLDSHQPSWNPAQWLDKNRELSWLPVSPQVAYGPHPDVQKGFNLFGHALYNGNGRIQLFYRPAADVLIPHWSLFAARKLRLDEEGIKVDDTLITHRSREVLINFVDREVILKQALSLDRALKRAEKNRDFSEVIEPDQIVLILPAMFTGSSDQVETPFGMIPGGYLMVSMVNSVVSGQWIRSFGPGWFEPLLLSCLGVLVGLMLTPTAFMSVFLLGLCGIASCGLLLFCFESIKIFWLIPNIAFGLMSLASFSWKMIRLDSKNQSLQQALADIIATDQLQKILKNPKSIVTEPSSQLVSIMFLDLVGFSLTSQRLTPKETFAQLKDLLKEASLIIHQHGGVIDKTLGDGLLCFFGYNLLGQSQDNHADQAVHCALEIQRKLYERCFLAFDLGQGLYPARIGINSAQVYIGNIGNETRFDFTLIGDGVNFASRLESACEPFRIMIGSDTRDLLLDQQLQQSLTPRYVRIKHSNQLVKAWQGDPFQNIPNAIEKVEDLYWSYAKLERKEDRIALPLLKVVLRSEFGLFELSDFSRTGLAFLSDIFLAKDVILDVGLDIEDPVLMKSLHDWGLTSFTVEIRWGKISQHRYKHGARILGLNDIQRTRIFELLSNERLTKAS